MKPVLTPAEMAAADQHAIAAGTPGSGARRARRTRGRAARAAHARRRLRAPCSSCGQGQQRGRRARRRALCLRAGGRASTELSSVEPASMTSTSPAVISRADLVVDAMYGTGFQGRLEGAARHERVVAMRWKRRPCRCSRSTSRPASTARPAPSRRGGVRERRSASRRTSPACCSSRVALTQVGVRGRHRYRDLRFRGDHSSRCSTWPTLRCPNAARSRTSGRRDVSSWAGRAEWSARRCSRARRRCVAARGWWCARCRGGCRRPGLGPGARGARAPGTPQRGARRGRGIRGAQRDVALPGARDRPRARSRTRHASGRRRIIAEADVPIVIDADALNAIAVDPAALRARHATLDCRSRFSRRTAASTSVSRAGRSEMTALPPLASSRRVCTRSSC